MPFSALSASSAVKENGIHKLGFGHVGIHQGNSIPRQEAAL
jgi:hypothetical protein